MYFSGNERLQNTKRGKMNSARRRLQNFANLEISTL